MKRRTNRLCAMMLMFLLLAAGAIAEETSAISPTTGLVTDRPYRPMMVQISNSAEARPSLNLAEADVVYEYIYWGPCHTRYTAIFNDVHPESVGYLRGSRVFTCELRDMWDSPLATHGGQDTVGTSITAYWKKHKLDTDAFVSDGTRGGKGFYRDQERISPHNLCFKLAKWVEESWPEDAKTGAAHEPRSPGLVFSDTPSAGDVPVTEIAFQYSHPLEITFGYEPSYTYVPEANHYLRAYAGWAQTDAAGEPYAVSNLLVLGHALDFAENTAARPVIPLMGAEGPLTAFIDGTMIQGRWTQDGEDSPMVFLDAEGAPLVLRPGKTFIQMVPEDMYEAGVIEDGSAFYDNVARYTIKEETT